MFYKINITYNKSTVGPLQRCSDWLEQVGFPKMNLSQSVSSFLVICKHYINLLKLGCYNTITEISLTNEFNF